MRHTAAVAVLALLLASAAEAKRAMRVAVNTPTGAVSTDARVWPWKRGFAVNDATAPEGTHRIVAFDADGKNPATLVTATASIEDWQTSPDGTLVSWIAGGKVHVTTPGKEADRELGSAEEGLAFSRDAGVLAFIADGKLVLQDVEGTRRRVAEPRQGRRLVAPVCFTADGKSVLVRSTPLKQKESLPVDTIERADAGAETPALTVLHETPGQALESLSVSPKDTLIAFLERGESRTVRVLDSATGKFHEFTRTSDFRSVAFSADGAHLLLVQPTGRSNDLGVEEQQLFKSGSCREFWTEVLSVDGQGAAQAPVSGAGGTWFVRRSRDNTAWDVVRASLR